MVNHLPDNIDKGLCIHRLCGDTGPCNDARMIFTVFSISRMSARLFLRRRTVRDKHPVMAQGQGQIHPLRQRKLCRCRFHIIGPGNGVKPFSLFT